MTPPLQVGPSTTCDHVAEGQKLIPGGTVRCRKCNAPLSVAPGGSSGVVNPGAVVAEYPHQPDQKKHGAGS